MSVCDGRNLREQRKTVAPSFCEDAIKFDSDYVLQSP